MKVQEKLRVKTYLLAILLPRVEMGLNRDGSANTLLLPHRPVLLKGRGTINRRLVGTGRLQDIIGATISSDAALLLCSRAGVVAAVCLDDVVLDERVARPSVQGDVAVDVGGVPRAVVSHGLAASRVPALAGDKVIHVVPGYVILIMLLGHGGYQKGMCGRTCPAAPLL
jgi:hypothetical protein